MLLCKSANMSEHFGSLEWTVPTLYQTGMPVDPIGSSPICFVSLAWL